jgi:hypothetical protein
MRAFQPPPYNAFDDAHYPTRRRPLCRFHLIVAILTSAVFTALGIVPVFADMTVLTYNILFCPSWAEAHERSLASLNHGRPPYPVKWKGCIVVERGTCVDVVEQQDQSTEIVIRGKHWITDEMPDVIAGRACPTTSPAGKRTP